MGHLGTWALVLNWHLYGPASNAGYPRLGTRSIVATDHFVPGMLAKLAAIKLVLFAGRNTASPKKTKCQYHGSTYMSSILDYGAHYAHCIFSSFPFHDCHTKSSWKMVSLKESPFYLFWWRPKLGGGLEHVFCFHIFGNNPPNWLSYFSERLKPPTRKKHPQYCVPVMGITCLLDDWKELNIYAFAPKEPGDNRQNIPRFWNHFRYIVNIV